MSTSGPEDGFGPDLSKPDQAIFCLHCDREFRMDQMVYEARFGDRPLWRCPNPKCNGTGLGMDLYTQPGWRETGEG
jgi:hypothetical protein